MAKSKYVCEYCSKKFYRYPSTVTGKKSFCSRACKAIWQQENCKGASNSNFGKEWSEEKKAEQSILVKLKMEDPGIRYAAGSANRGKKFSEDRVRSMHGHRSKQSYSRPHSIAAKKKIGDSSRSRWTVEYKERNRKIREDRRLWKSIDQLSDYVTYFKESEWDKKLNSYIENKDIQKFYEEPHKYVRDHVYGRHQGFLNGVFPPLLRHPANCEIITRSENISKRHSEIQDLGCSIEELFFNIENYPKKYHEQNECLRLIENYVSGLRWSRDKL